MEKTSTHYLNNVSGKMTVNITKMRQQADSNTYVSITNPIVHLKYIDQEKKSSDYNLNKQEVHVLDNEGTEQLPCWKEAFEFDVKGFDNLS